MRLTNAHPTIEISTSSGMLRITVHPARSWLVVLMDTRRRSLTKIVVALCFCVVFLPNSLLVTAQDIPSVTGHVMDAVSGKPIGGVALALQISTYHGFSVHTEVKSTATSGLSGSFSLAGWNHPARTALDEIRAYWLTVNEGFEATGQEENSAETQILYNPMANRRNVAVGNVRYFPTTITFRQEGCGSVWVATCMQITSWSNIAIPLIPVWAT